MRISGVPHGLLVLDLPDFVKPEHVSVFVKPEHVSVFVKPEHVLLYVEGIAEGKDAKLVVADGRDLLAVVILKRRRLNLLVRRLLPAHGLSCPLCVSLLIASL